MMTAGNKPEALYLHVPFCRHICFYCDFCHVVWQPEKSRRWLEALEKEISSRQISPHLRTIYIGGGTPSCLPYDQLERLLQLLQPYSTYVEEYTIEINPETLDERKAELMASFGINRASIGMQSSDKDLLKMMGRRHDLNMVKTTAGCLRRAGISNISLDLMYSLPGQTMEVLKQSVDDALSMDPDHLSLYSLTVEENTVFGKKGMEHLDDDTEADMYEWITKYLEEKGYHQYEISNFAKAGRESEHNLTYWRYDDFYGVSCGASGKENGCRYDNIRDLNAYLEDPLSREVTVLDEDDRIFETVMMGLRMRRGMDMNRFAERYGRTMHEVFGKDLDRMLVEGLLEEEGNMLRCTDRGFELLNEILIELMR